MSNFKEAGILSRALPLSLLAVIVLTSVSTFLPILMGAVRILALVAFLIYVWYEHERSQAQTPYRLSITRIGSRVFTGFCRWTLPTFARPILYKAFAKMYGVRLFEMSNPDLKSYPTMSHFFTREIISKTRPIGDGVLVSPCDGRVLSVGEITDNEMKGAVKDQNYPFDEFLLGMKRKNGIFSKQLL